MSGICPFAVAKIIPPGSSDPRIKPRVAILHVDAGNTFSLYDYFKNRSGGIESHFHVRNDGMIEQYRDIYWQADANYKANDFAVSIETQGYGHGKWNADQLASIKRLLLWLNEEAGIPLVKCPTWDGAGVGYHTQFGAPGAWTPVAKSCPGPDRIKQYHSDLVPWLDRAPRTQSPEGLIMDSEVKAAFDELNEKVDAMAKDLARSKQFLAYSRKRELLTNKRLKDLGLTAEQIEATLEELGAESGEA